MSPKEGPSQKEISSSKHWIFKGYVSFRGPRINLVIHFGIHVWLKYLGWIEQCLCDGLRWLGMIECLTRELVIGLVQNDWVDEWKICWEMVAVRIWSVTSRFSCGPSLLADCYLKLPTTVLVHMVFQYYSSHIYRHLHASVVVHFHAPSFACSPWKVPENCFKSLDPFQTMTDVGETLHW